MAIRPSLLPVIELFYYTADYRFTVVLTSGVTGLGRNWRAESFMDAEAYMGELWVQNAWEHRGDLCISTNTLGSLLLQDLHVC